MLYYINLAYNNIRLLAAEVIICYCFIKFSFIVYNTTECYFVQINLLILGNIFQFFY